MALIPFTFKLSFSVVVKGVLWSSRDLVQILVPLFTGDFGKPGLSEALRISKMGSIIELRGLKNVKYIKTFSIVTGPEYLLKY